MARRPPSLPLYTKKGLRKQPFSLEGKTMTRTLGTKKSLAAVREAYCLIL